MAEKFVRIADKFWASAQISAKDVEAAKALGVSLIICNRPDGEDPFQPSSAEIAAAAKAVGIDYVHIPVANAAAIADLHLAAFAKAVAGAKGGVLAYCRSGTRSTVLRALMRASAGDDPDAIVAEAAKAGYDISGLRPRLEATAMRRD